jgi:hypothetical protein
VIARLSLTARLTLLFTLVRSPCCWLWPAGRRAIERHFEDLDRAELTGKLQHAQHLIAQVDSLQLERLSAPLGMHSWRTMTW